MYVYIIFKLCHSVWIKSDLMMNLSNWNQNILFFNQKYVVDTQKTRLYQTVLMSTETYDWLRKQSQFDAQKFSVFFYWTYGAMTHYCPFLHGTNNQCNVNFWCADSYLKLIPQLFLEVKKLSLCRKHLLACRQSCGRSTSVLYLVSIVEKKHWRLSEGYILTDFKNATLG